MQKISFLIIGGLAFVIDFMFFSLLIVNDVDAAIARLFALVIAVCVTFFANRQFTFKSAQSGAVSQQLVRQIVWTCVSSLINYVLFLMFLSLMLESFVAFSVAVLLTTLINYWASKHFVFQVTQ